jgi:protease-4
MGASGAYLAATGADTIIASEISDVGGIGITMSYLDNVAENQTLGLNYNELTSAPFKDSGSPDRELSEEERALFEKHLAIYHDVFVREVSENRNLPYEKVAELADGSTLPGALAKEAGLIDTLGDQETAREWFAETLGIEASEVVFCE